MNYRDFTMITADSRKVIPGALFIAVRGYQSDGHAYIQAAIDKGAKGIVCEYIPEGMHIPESSLRDPSHLRWAPPSYAAEGGHRFAPQHPPV